MTDRQKLALTNPIDPTDLDALHRFTTMVKWREWKLATVLTVDHLEELWWHATVAVATDTAKPLQIKSLKFRDRKEIERVARDLLLGVGGNEEHTSYDEVMFHIIRRLTPTEKRTARPDSE